MCNHQYIDISSESDHISVVQCQHCGRLQEIKYEDTPNYQERLRTACSKEDEF